MNHRLCEEVLPQLVGHRGELVDELGEPTTDGALRPGQPDALREEPRDVADGLAHVKAHPGRECEGLGTDSYRTSEVGRQRGEMVFLTGTTMVFV